MRYFLAIILSLIYVSSNACSCDEINSQEAFDSLRRNMDFLIIGTPKSSISFKEEISNRSDNWGYGFNVKFEIDSVLKGSVTKNVSILIKQDHLGSCKQTFIYGEKYILFGYQIDQVIQNSETITLDSDILIPPEPDILKDGILYTNSPLKENSLFWNRITKENTVIDTDQCQSFSMKNKYIIKYLN